MGTEIDLTIDGIVLDWSKNSMGIDHGCLFQADDLTRRPAHGYFSENELDAAPYESVFVRRLAHMLPRLDMIRHNLESARIAYEAAVREAVETAQSITSIELPTDFMSFDEFSAFCRQNPLSSLSDQPSPADESDVPKPPGRFAALSDEMRRIPSGPDFYPWQRSGQSEREYFDSSVCILDAYSMMQILGSGGVNADAEVAWQFGPLVESGWEEATSFVAGARRQQRVMVATEGTSDASIVRRALEVLRPDVADFFHFIDVNENHPFWGTGGLVKFAEGLVRINVQNQILFLLNKDAEGRDADRRLRKLAMPGNMRTMVLPDQAVFNSFAARGPQGVSASDINGRAAAIECYLDLDLPNVAPAQVTWSNYKRDMDAWHGVLDFKESYAKRFFAQKDDDLLGGGYDTSKLEAVLDALIAEATILVSSRVF